MDTLCAEVLLTGLLWVNGKTIDLDKRNQVYISYQNQEAYVVPDEYALITANCTKKERVPTNLSKSVMQNYIKKIN